VSSRKFPGFRGMGREDIPSLVHELNGPSISRMPPSCFVPGGSKSVKEIAVRNSKWMVEMRFESHAKIHHEEL
jgi:hypothetical protein